jgi:glycosyltransferase involved in cell wall biosynthesis
MDSLVSIISPCYNGEEYVSRMLDSILSQTYTNIEMICVDDGSTDKTADIISSYSSKFKENNMSLKLIHQDNQGQASAINNALKIVNGDYLCWIDCDDFLTEDSVEIRLDVLKQNPEYGVCSSDIFIVDESDTTKILNLVSKNYGHFNYQHNAFILTICGLNPLACNSHMISMECFDRANPNRELYLCREGQNMQILLPVYYHYPRYYIDKPLGYYVFRRNSHFHSLRTKEQNIKRLNSLNCMLRATLQGLNITPREIDKLVKLSAFTVELTEIQNS